MASVSLDVFAGSPGLDAFEQLCLDELVRAQPLIDIDAEDGVKRFHRYTVASLSQAIDDPDIRSEVMDIVASNGGTRTGDWVSIRAAILERWIPPRFQSALDAVDAFVAKPSTDLAAYGRRFKVLWEAVVSAATVDKPATRIMCADRFLLGLPLSIRDRVADQLYDSVADACLVSDVRSATKIAIDVERKLRAIGTHRGTLHQGLPPLPSTSNTAVSTQNRPFPLQPAQTPLSPGTSELERRLRALESVSSSPTSGQHAFALSACLYCDKLGHKKRDCSALAEDLAKGLIIERDGKVCLANGRIPQLARGRGGIRASVAVSRVSRISLIDDAASTTFDVREDELGSFDSDMLELCARLSETGDDANASRLLHIFLAKRQASASDRPDPRKRANAGPPPQPLASSSGSTASTSQPPPVTHSSSIPPPPAAGNPDWTPLYRLGSKIEDAFSDPSALASKVLTQPLGQGTSVTFGDLLSNSPSLRRYLNDQLRPTRITLSGPRNESSTTRPAEGNVSRVGSVTSISGALSAATPKIPVVIESKEIVADVDGGSEICVISKKVQESLGLGLLTSFTGKIQLAAADHVAEVVGLCCDVPVHVGPIKTRVSFYVLPAAPFDVLLGRPWLVATNCEERNDRPETPHFTLCQGDVRYELRGLSRQQVVERIDHRDGSHNPTRTSNDSAVVRRITFEPTKSPEFNVWKTKYKSVAQKVRPVAVDVADGSIPFVWPRSSASTADGENRWTRERLDALHLGSDFPLSQAEIELIEGILRRHDKAFAFSTSERGLLRSDIFPAHRIRTVPHEPWSDPPHSIPRALLPKVVELLRKRIAEGVLEPSRSSYSTAWFVIPKSSGDLRFIQDCQRLNSVTIRESGVPPRVDEITEECAGYPLYAQLDLMSAYDQVPLDPTSRDLLTLRTPLGLLRMTRMPQGATNAVSVFCNVVACVFGDAISDRASLYLDDCCIHGSARGVDDDEISPGVRKMVADFAESLDLILARTEQAGLTFSATKTQIAVRSVHLLGYRCDIDGRHPKSDKIAAIVNWPSCKSLTELRGFVALAGFFRSWVQGFSQKAAPLTLLTKKNQPFIWGSEQQEAMDVIKSALTSAPILRPPCYDKDAGELIMTCDAGPCGGGGSLEQIVDGKRAVCRYVSFSFNSTQRGYGQIKRELLAMTRVLKALRIYVFGADFTLETDCEPLIGLIRRNDAIDPAVSRWIAFVHLFAPRFRHVKGCRNVVADGLSRRPMDSDNHDGDGDSDVEDIVDGYVGTIRITDPNRLPGTLDTLGEDHRRIYLGLTGQLTDFDRAGRRRLSRYIIREGQLFRRTKRHGEVPRLVLDMKEDQDTAILECHQGEGGGHRGFLATLRKAASRFFWSSLSADVKNFVSSCEVCQRFSNDAMVEPLKPTWTDCINAKWGVDVIHLPYSQEGFSMVICAREDLSGWLEARMLRTKNAKDWTSFMYEEVFCRHGAAEVVITDHGELDSREGRDFFDSLGIKLRFSSPFHPQTNGMVERGHATFKKALAKIAFENGSHRWPLFFYAALWADRATVRAVTGYSPFELMYGRTAALPIDLGFMTWSIGYYRDNMSEDELIASRAMQLAKLQRMNQDAAERLRASRVRSKIRWDQRFNVRTERLSPGTWVLLQSTRSSALEPRWQGPYVVHRDLGNGAYMIGELSGAVMRNPVAGARLKIFRRVEDDAMGPPVDVTVSSDAGGGPTVFLSLRL